MEETTNKINTIEIPGTARIRKITMEYSSMELLELCSILAKEKLDKKLWSVLSRVHVDKKGFDYNYVEGMDAFVKDILDADIQSELKIQTFTSFKLPSNLLPEVDKINAFVRECDEKRKNIVAYFISDYNYVEPLYDYIRSDDAFLKELIKVLNIDGLISLFKVIFVNENKEYITGAIRLVGETKRKFVYENTSDIDELTAIVFEEKRVFFTSKLLFCTVFNVPEEIVKKQKDLDKILKISINYEERITKEFVKNYNLSFDISDEAMCRYYIGNKKAKNQRALVTKFACHIVRIEDKETVGKLLRGAFKRGGAFRMYAGCMQDGRIIPEKMQRFHYTEEEVQWCSNLPGLKK